MVMQRYEFLEILHRTLQPNIYLEVGVQLGYSLRLAQFSSRVIGIDPHPMTAPRGNEMIYPMLSRDFWEGLGDHFVDPIDMAYIDGSHLFEDAAYDYLAILPHTHARSVIVFDDVLPYNEAIATRVCPPGGDWTGDVWRVEPWLREHASLSILVDVAPTGVLVVLGGEVPPGGEPTAPPDEPPPVEVIHRHWAESPNNALNQIDEWLRGVR